MDLRAAEDTVLKPGARFLMPTGFAIADDQNDFFDVGLFSASARAHFVSVSAQGSAGGVSANAPRFTPTRNNTINFFMAVFLLLDAVYRLSITNKV